MTSRDRIAAVLSFEKPRPMPIMDMGYWNETMERWRAEGLPAHLLDVPEGDYLPGVDLRTYWGGDYLNRMRIMQIEDYFGIEHWLVPPRLPVIDTVFPFYEPVIIEEKAESRIVRDRLGVVSETPKTATAFPRFVRFPVETRADYEALRPLLDPATPGRYCRGWDIWAEHQIQRGQPVSLWFRGFFGFPRDLLGLENLCIAYYEAPDLVQDILADRCAFVKGLLTPALERFPIDCALIWEDMAYNHGAMISPDLFRRFMLPYYQEITAFLHRMGVRHVLVDSDGNIVSLTALFQEGGVDGIYPLEAAAGSDPGLMRDLYPGLSFLGGFDKRALAGGRATIDRELERLAPVLAKGGSLLMVDHLVPPDVSLESYLYYLERRRELF